MACRLEMRLVYCEVAIVGSSCAPPLLTCWRTATTALSPSSIVVNRARKLGGSPVSWARWALYWRADSSLALTRLSNSAAAFFFSSESAEAICIVTAARSFCRLSTSRRMADRAGRPPVVACLVTSPAPPRRRSAIDGHLQTADPDGSDLRDSTMPRKKEKAQPGTDQSNDRPEGPICRVETILSYA